MNRRSFLKAVSSLVAAAAAPPSLADAAPFLEPGRMTEEWFYRLDYMAWTYVLQYRHTDGERWFGYCFVSDEARHDSAYMECVREDTLRLIARAVGRPTLRLVKS